jgi:uncharacterized protein YbbC (DUF1343 family)
MIRTGLDQLLEEASALTGRSYGLLTHLAAVSSEMVPAHLALARSAAGAPARLFGPEHGVFALTQDMEATAEERDPWTGAEIVSLYGDDVASLRPRPGSFEGLDVLVIDLQDVGARYYTYAATAVWSAREAIASGCEVWLLDRPNPLGGEVIEGNLRRPGFDSFVGAFEHPVRHGLTMGELVRLELDRGAGSEALRVWPLQGWSRSMEWPATGRPWIAPSPNMPTFLTALIYPGLCLVEATSVSEGRGTTRPFQLVGAPEIDPLDLADRLNARSSPGVRFVPNRFRPEFQKHGGSECGGVEIVVTDTAVLEPFRLGVELILELARSPGFAWRRDPYEFVADVPAIDLLTGDVALREAAQAGAEPLEWLDSWAGDEARFREQREPFLLYE